MLKDQSRDLLKHLSDVQFRYHENCNDKSINFTFFFGTNTKDMQDHNQESFLNSEDSDLFGETRLNNTSNPQNNEQESISIENKYSQLKLIQSSPAPHIPRMEVSFKDINYKFYPRYELYVWQLPL